MVLKTHKAEADRLIRRFQKNPEEGMQRFIQEAQDWLDWVARLKAQQREQWAMYRTSVHPSTRRNTNSRSRALLSVARTIDPTDSQGLQNRLALAMFP